MSISFSNYQGRIRAGRGSRAGRGRIRAGRGARAGRGGRAGRGSRWDYANGPCDKL